MNLKVIKEIIEQYKQRFGKIHNEEIYKWQAVKYFQDNWDIEAPDFYNMLDHSLALSGNLLASGHYFPRGMILKITKTNPEQVRQLFRELYNEEASLIERITAFQTNIQKLNVEMHAGSHHYQDHRALVVYLCLHYPDRYYLYKYGMFNTFAHVVDLPYKPSKGVVENLFHYFKLCEMLKSQILQDNDLLKLHKERITEGEFFDSSFNILTQDVIYAASRHFSEALHITELKEPALTRLEKVDAVLKPTVETVNFKGTFTNYSERDKKNTQTGYLGECLVFKHEQEKLKKLGVNKKPIHTSITEGNGLGYDIQSYDQYGNEILIEVKTTRGPKDTPFYITNSELERSKRDGRSFYLYRLYEYDEQGETAKCIVQQGDLTNLCINPIVYRVWPNDHSNTL